MRSLTFWEVAMAVKVKLHRGAFWLFIDHQGKRKAKRVGTGKAGKVAAELAAAKIAARLAEGGSLELEAAPAVRVPTFKDVAEAWPAWYQGLYPTKHNTARNHASAIRTHL